MDGFIAIVDAIGGVTITIDETFTLEGVTFTPGTHTLSGIEAEKFVRERHSRSGGDIGRINAQRQFLAALFSEMKDLSASELTSLASVVMQNVTTDLSVGTALSLVQEILTMDTDNMSFYMLPGRPPPPITASRSGAPIRTSWRPSSTNISAPIPTSPRRKTCRLKRSRIPSITMTTTLPPSPISSKGTTGRGQCGLTVDRKEQNLWR